ncbi:MAG TPA: biotin--[acetyl-CoA-carboxylase] ligase [Solirubrobacteraceae bacterium]|jgi:BirA family biotin operon repressor/biotin-[acetyl-CoA-carboxylase] ligase|nr:biotin--[acetyl-CoA-carboxylase] ligase [Solirubrobacteraceae bacterium]
MTPEAGAGVLGHPRVHLRQTDSTNERARALAVAGAPHGTLVTAGEQTAGRGRQGRAWWAPPGSSLLCSLVLRDPPPLLSLIAGVAVCDAIGERARVKWPNDVVIEMPSAATRRDPQARPALAKLAGILVEGRPQERWAVLGVGLNVGVRPEDLPVELRERAVSLELPASAIEPILERLIQALERRLGEPAERALEAWRERDALFGREVSWGAQDPRAPLAHGQAQGIDDAGRLIVRLEDGATEALDAGEVHLGQAC